MYFRKEEGFEVALITKERLKREIDNVQDGYLDALFQVIKAFEYAPPPGHRDIPFRSPQRGAETMQDWLTFVATTYGSLASDPIERGEQGMYEVREDIV